MKNSTKMIMYVTATMFFLIGIALHPVTAFATDDFAVETQVRLAGEKEWKESVDAKVGDKVEFQIKYTNTSDQQQDNVVIKDILPSNLRYVAGSTKLKNTHYPKGTSIQEDYLVTDGMNIGSYVANGGNAFLMFTAEVVDDNLACGKNTLVNWAQAGVGDTTIQDEARVAVQNNKIFYVIAAIYIVTVTICLIIIIILARKVIKLSKAKNKARNKNSAEV